MENEAESSQVPPTSMQRSSQGPTERTREQSQSSAGRGESRVLGRLRIYWGGHGGRSEGDQSRNKGILELTAMAWSPR